MFENYDELSELMVASNESMDKIVKWMGDHKNDEYFKTEDGKILNTHIIEMAKNHAYIYGDIATFLWKDFNNQMEKHRKNSYKGS